MSKKIWATNNIIEKQFDSLEDIPSDWIPHKRLRWSKERKQARCGKGNPMFGKVGYWKGKKQSEETRLKKSVKQKAQFESGEKQPWNKGLSGDPRCKGHHPGTPPWNKGLTEKTDERVANNLRGWRDGTCQKKSYNTKKKNKSFKNKNTKAEQIVYTYLLTLFDSSDIYKQYRDDIRYPFTCDFYVQSKDLFVEVNAFWHHGPHPFDINNEQDLKLLEKWKSKVNGKNQFYEAVKTWTERDVKKFEFSKKNNLNYVVFYFKEVQRLSKELSERNIQNNNQVE